ncbi:ADP-ribose pyrophosphatase [Candidatus Woesearchaeota archaeon CG08_land_8_20_14_0_20_47_9]|nr:MAG: hypothetical protein AUJ69_00280 [Candidatus Woesearchaeota archaeon CG1_02_47_18]PIN76073.1 MAG: ADP-ribose pyrophosphatase [Candidatus Woesearchaeota archaeon CG10_big_fil_rev_8_21_14_0_10_47_5]PIO03669.1 MAG: ADP-ribose pyrophosphatase [Candidatus Woesearchaeota archaeon CG08_land_8_20_14_0_20_47_9]HII29739.1 NUDIX domain-containing protein [Candidatus Woesearchaeota archaeon]
MQLLKEISDKDTGSKQREDVRYSKGKFRLRNAARAVLFDKDDNIALLFVSRHNFHKLPGGGLDPGEDIRTALKREVLEETGCTIAITGEVGRVVEYRDKYRLKQISYCFIARVKENSQKTSLTEKEKRQGLQLTWVKLDEAIRLIENDQPNTYEGRFIVRRDLAFLRKAGEIIQS